MLALLAALTVSAHAADLDQQLRTDRALANAGLATAAVAPFAVAASAAVFSECFHLFEPSPCAKGVEVAGGTAGMLGLTAHAVGTPTLAGASLAGAYRLRSAGVDVPTWAGWGSVGLFGAEVGLVVIAATMEDPPEALAIAALASGGGALVLGLVQHRETGRAMRDTGLGTDRPPLRAGVAPMLTPRGGGVAIVATW